MQAANRIKASAALSPANFAFACLLFAWFWSDYRAYWLDDAYITFRYSQHFAQGMGAVYNVGERVEGYTSFLWMLLCAAPLAVLSTGTALVTLKASSFAASLWILFRVWTFPGPAAQVRRHWVLILATQPVFILNSGDGMETPLFVVLMVECLLALQADPDRRGGVKVGLLVAGMSLTRPESLPLLVAIPALVLLADRRDATRAGQLKDWMRAFVLCGVGVVLLHELFRWGYYGDPLPNTYYAKATGSQLDRIASGARDVSQFLFENPWRAPVAIWVCIGLASFATLRLAQARDPRTTRWLGGLWLMIAFRLSFDLWSGSDAMGRHRFLAPLLVPLAILADEGARSLWKGPGRAVVVGLAVLCLYFNITGHSNHAWSIGEYRKGLERAHIELGTWLTEKYPAETVISVSDAGAIPFYSGMTTIDMWGLNDRTIAHMPGEYGMKDAMPDYVFGRDPDVIVLWNQVPFLEALPEGRDHRKARVVGGSQLDVMIAKHPQFGSDYRFAREFVFRKHGPEFPGYYLDVFEKK